MSRRTPRTRAGVDAERSLLVAASDGVGDLSAPRVRVAAAATGKDAEDLCSHGDVLRDGGHVLPELERGRAVGSSAHGDSHRAE